MLNDSTSCKKTRHRVQITCVDPGEDSEAQGVPRETFVMYESCKIDVPLALGYFVGIMFAILAFSSPVVVIRRRRLR